MGRATRWLRGIFGIKSGKDKVRNEYSGDKGGWSSGPTGLCHNPATIPPNITPAEVAWLRSFYGDNDTEQNKHAIAVAAATAAAADAAVAAAQAAVAVVRLTSQGRGREKLAALQIQAVFRGFLARKALRALKGLVKIQALVRGFLVRKQAAATLHSMQALIRAQASVRAEKLRRLIRIDESFPFPPQYEARISREKSEDERSGQFPTSLHSRRLSASFEEESPKIVEVDTGCRPKSRARRASCSTQYLAPDEESWAEDCHFSTAQSTPRFFTGSSGPVTPAKSACTDSYFRGEGPNYMAKTQSFKAKVRSHSAPRQRPEPGPRRRLSMESRSSLSGVRMQRSCSQAQEAINFKNAVMGKLATYSSHFLTQDTFFYPN